MHNFTISQDRKLSGLTSQSSALEVRLAARDGRLSGHTSGLASAHVQVNLVILPANLAEDFRRFCELNPIPCPLFTWSEPGAPLLPVLGRNLDVRTDVPRYHIWKHGARVADVTDLREWWREDLVTFALGCSYSFEHTLLEAGIPLRHVTEGRNVAMYRSNIQTNQVGIFAGPTVVSMRPLKAADAIHAVQLTARTPRLHGAPIHIGNPELIGINDLSRPDYGDAVAILDDELPVFWACGVTPQAAISAACPEFCITHAPGCMLVTDLLNAELLS
ncbi:MULTISPECIES: putative hydro-lyase [unclassified Herbaspirillum]|uniref:putative hydro-lyase n=1 Tax=unclassified Herbaspirillum TaxID=2624150 RepID=UPI001150EBDC|nr:MULTISPECIES: putative hydro-lyase [unclassified Herbaspirillum]MBB5390540.1 uncharacterized protein YcsI (UPF0317 family) [Herbaspirillum sp. SJZ102]TQK08971.1 uncharacterized protein YcsI (UPF0317 family) [Herbaspirillum sp. SJZ130]TQK14342.1 uncharacterized protein YcsI (UPF0317 family) [Herbaspirillum sp. SJZ106]TWC66641.1 uncharacterized protein YcsI (UPF0317 family) [Herbaspirillum sp. SJZ099]